MVFQDPGENLEFKGYDKPQFDQRVKKVMALENTLSLIVRAAGILAVSIAIGLIFGGLAQAEAIHDLFLVPYVTMTRSGAAVLQPQTGGGYNAVNNGGDLGGIAPATATTTRNTVVEAGKPSNFDGGGAYISPTYDAFSPDSLNQTVQLPANRISAVNEVDFSIRNNLAGTNDQSAGTTKTIFTFTGAVNSRNSRGFEYRWDFENDNQVDSYFSGFNSITHVFKTPGEYEIKMEVLDREGTVSEAMHKVYIAENDAPKAYFRVNTLSAPVNSIIRFDTSLSSDNQYNRGYLVYRFDWDGDGKWDTNAQNKTSWAHLYRQAGTYSVIMEATDPEGLTSKAGITIDITDDLAPEARMSVERLANFRYQFDASESTDDFTPKNRLKFRWDFNYEGTDDIIFDTSWSNSPKYTGYYRLGGSKNIRLQVMDEQGFVDENFAQIEVTWPEEYLNLAMDGVGI